MQYRLILASCRQSSSCTRPFNRVGIVLIRQAKNLSQPTSSPTLSSHLSTHTPLSSSLLLGPLPLLLPPTHASTSSISHTLSHLSTLLTTVNLLRNLPGLVSQKRQINIPSDICAKHNIVEEDVLRNGSAAVGLKDGLWEIGTRGMDELITARREVGKEGNGGKVTPGSVMPLFLSVVSESSARHQAEGAKRSCGFFLPLPLGSLLRLGYDADPRSRPNPTSND